MKVNLGLVADPCVEVSPLRDSGRGVKVGFFANEGLGVKDGFGLAVEPFVKAARLADSGLGAMVGFLANAGLEVEVGFLLKAGLGIKAGLGARGGSRSDVVPEVRSGFCDLEPDEAALSLATSS